MYILFKRSEICFINILSEKNIKFIKLRNNLNILYVNHHILF